ncbi:hypothetical protein SODALDRAFT_293850 [Sodiomyces alkalinus F11]|uniref:Exoribonuclease phosphorolytic domain-containing protein n=1 Tax=Sodiomyces alkalinus (strain CBS 110278 / VKM F-3762 / F11) TaxID=1314773 RepID=A0A3N2Q004_SODAK|nr:hypothetical protein SODALDRAFT_293850 [Sodiomyces alkalinus F11]ROT40101.1 hypothetical protein SODALDRAFT_293850 [Sodiomyces alkalinus F11]
MMKSHPNGHLSHLNRTDGSATLSNEGYQVVASVNGPMEAQRREENPFEAIIDVVLRPLAGIGGTRERQLESIIERALRQLILVKRYPRCVFQVTLQVTQTHRGDLINDKAVQAHKKLAWVASLLHAAILALLAAAVPLKEIATCVVIATPREAMGREPIRNPSAEIMSKAKSLHLLCFTTSGALLLAESEGECTLEEWDAAMCAGRATCCRQLPIGEIGPNVGLTGV